MLYKNAEIHNAAELNINPEDGSMTWCRVPGNVFDAMEAEQGQRICLNSTGVEIRFVMKSDTAVIRMQAISDKATHACFHIFRGGIQGGWRDHEINTYVCDKPQDFVIEKSANLPVLREIAKAAGDEFDPEVVRVIFDRGSYRILDIRGDIEPPKKSQLPQQTLLCYGSSITHGSNSIDASHTWASVLAHKLNMDLINLGMAGSCAMEPAMINYIASEGEKGNWNTAIMELGINVLRWEPEKIISRVTNAVSEVAGRNPDKKIFVISPFYCGSDYQKKPEPDRWRRLIAEVVHKTAYKNVMLINGLDLLGDMSLISADEVHPNIYGVQQIASRLLEPVSAFLDK